jgi:hypothetical protein
VSGLNVRARITVAREALRAGDVHHAEVVLADLDHDLARAAQGRSRVVCPQCRSGFDWPGQLTDHLRDVHGVVDEELPL